jgi:hypothetical protein
LWPNGSTASVSLRIHLNHGFVRPAHPDHA